MEKSLDWLAIQAKNNINILSVTPLSQRSSNDGVTTMVSVAYEFQYRPVAGGAPHWVKTCDIIPYASLVDEVALREIIVNKVRAARAGLEG